MFYTQRMNPLNQVNHQSISVLLVSLMLGEYGNGDVIAT